MQLSWQQASSNYRLKKKKWQNNEIKEKIRQITKGELQKSHDGTGGQLGTGSLGPHRNENEEKEEQIIRRELRRCGLI